MKVKVIKKLVYKGIERKENEVLDIPLRDFNTFNFREKFFEEVKEQIIDFPAPLENKVVEQIEIKENKVKKSKKIK
jgi:hypothetical protein